MIDTKSLERIDVVDTSRDILDMSSIIYPDPSRDPLRDSRVKVHVEDGRHFLETHMDRYDLITGEPPPPKIAGITNLFTQEYFEAIYDRLDEGGVATYWLPVHGLLESEAKSILRAFCDVFDDCSLWNGAPLDWVMLGTRNLEGPVARQRFDAQWNDPSVAPELRELGIEVPEQLGALFMSDAATLQTLLRDTPPLDDDHPGRIGTRVIGPRRALMIYGEWLDAKAASERFAASETIAAIWPEGLVRSTLPYFEWRGLAVDFLSRKPRGVGATLHAFDRLQRETKLRTLPLWILGGTVDAQRAIQSGASQGWPASELDAQRGIGAAVAGDYEGALEGLSSARLDALRWHLSIYARCKLGLTAEALRTLKSTPRHFRDPRAAKVLGEICSN